MHIKPHNNPGTSSLTVPFTPQRINQIFWDHPTSAVLYYNFTFHIILILMFFCSILWAGSRTFANVYIKSICTSKMNMEHFTDTTLCDKVGFVCTLSILSAKTSNLFGTSKTRNMFSSTLLLLRNHVWYITVY